MTTIAWDGKTLAADTQWTCAYVQQHSTPKIHTANGIAWGAAGDAGSALLFDEWMRDGRPDDKKPYFDKDLFVAIVVENGKAFRYEYALIPIPAGRPAATGSGGEIAMGAMMAGATAQRAVEIAIALDMGCGGEITVLSC